MKALLSIFFCLVTCINVFAQEGGYFLTHYSPSSADINNVNFDIAQNQRGVICIANRSGVVLFDGKNWERIQTPSAIFSVAIDDKNVLYTAGSDGFGKISNSQEDYQEYISLSDSTTRDVFDMLIFQDKLYGINPTNIFIYDLTTGKQKKIKSAYSGDLLKLLEIQGKVYVNTEISGVKLIEDNSLSDPPQDYLNGKFIEFVSRQNETTYLLGESNNQLSILTDKTLKKLDVDSEYLNESVAIDGAWVNDSLVSIATLKGGVVFINPKKEEVEQVVNYSNGLPDNEVLAMVIDSYRGLWVAHNEGFTRISPSFPFRSFDRYPGLEGDLIAVQSHNEQLYVGTSLGLFYLDEVSEYSQKTILEKQIVRQQQQKPSSAQKERKGLFGFLKRDKKEKQEDVQPSRNITKITSRTERILEDTWFEYKKVDGIDAKVNHLSVKDGRLYSGGLDGLYVIQDSTATQITNVPTRSFFVSETYQKLFVSTYDDKFEVFNINRGRFTKTELLNDFSDWVSYIFEDHENRIWFCSSSEIYWIKLENNEIVASEEYAINNPFFYETYGVAYDKKVYFVNESGIYLFDENKKQLKRTKENQLRKYLKDNTGAVWLLKDDKWQTLGAKFTSSQLDVLSVFTDVEHISYDESQKDFWVLTKDKNLYKINADQSMGKTLAEYDLYLKDIRTTNEVFLPKPKLKFDQQSSPLTFEFVQPEYTGVLNTEYQYKLIGLSDKWSEWSSGYNVIPIPYLPDGDYELKMRSRNIVSGIKEMPPIKFEILPPYWKRPWFLALEFSALVLLLFLSVKLKKLGYKYRMMSRLLALLTLIIIIEFIQTVAENEFGTQTSPVIDFIIQIIVAIIILPVEGLLRKYIFREKNVQILDFISLKNKKK
ncbi:hypothetical protein E1176_15395 [Fulvivirga sp. RKSG066]|uniref:hypothetical protein n=1 Tax=Fulvivirga aurantia TaxID=2529383 RepID=UPI0012BC3F9E|nr:hypothetical protein [Fulvivirga aurantia]MTI22416.1 hypothetical protein [Fulvivirga aurantia]